MRSSRRFLRLYNLSPAAWQRLVPDCHQWGTPCTDILNPAQATGLWRYKRMYAVDSTGRLAVAFLPIGVGACVPADCP